MFTLCRIALRRHENHTIWGLCSLIRMVISARFLQRSEAVPRRSLKSSVTYRIGYSFTGKYFVSVRKAIRYVWYEHSLRALRDRRHFLLRLAAAA